MLLLCLVKSTVWELSTSSSSVGCVNISAESEAAWTTVWSGNQFGYEFWTETSIWPEIRTWRRNWTRQTQDLQISMGQHRNSRTMSRTTVIRWSAVGDVGYPLTQKQQFEQKTQKGTTYGRESNRRSRNRLVWVHRRGVAENRVPERNSEVVDPGQKPRCFLTDMNIQEIAYHLKPYLWPPSPEFLRSVVEVLLRQWGLRKTKRE